LLSRAVLCSCAGSGVDDAGGASLSALSKRLELDVPGADGNAGRVTVETGEIGRQAAGSVVVTCGETVIYCSVCSEGDSEDPAEASAKKEGMVPLTVVYAERFSAAGRTAGGFLKRDGRPRDQEALTARLVDRPIRPMFPKGWAKETQILAWLLSYDGVNKPEPLAITAAGCALALSDIPLSRAVAGVRVARVWPVGEGGDPADALEREEGCRYVVNPSVDQLARADLDLIVGGTTSGVLMVEGSGDLVENEVALEAIEVAHGAIREMCRGIDAWAEELGKPKRVIAEDSNRMCDADAQALLAEAGGEMKAALSVQGKQDRAVVMGQLKDELRRRFGASPEDAVEETSPSSTSSPAGAGSGPDLIPAPQFNSAFKSFTSFILRSMVIEDGVRMDGRGLGEVRPIWSRAHVLPRTHGSALFTRGETQALVVATLGDDKSAQRIDAVHFPLREPSGKKDGDGMLKRFNLQYFFPPCSVGEVGRMGGPGRRELGHGELAERALLPVIPDKEDFPYTMRVESTITESNGSSSMASVCGATLALRDAGVPLKADIAGVAMGLILDAEGSEGEDEISYKILSDILGSEDALGDMDFKVAGDASGISALQMDIKVEGITVGIMRAALQEAEKARGHILGEMGKCSPPPRMVVSPHAPAIHTLVVDPKCLGMVIGSGGKNVKQLISDFGVDSISCNVDGKPEGTIEIVGTPRSRVLAAAEHIESMCLVPKEGDIFREVPVVEILPFGCLVEYAPGRQALCHISELAAERTEKVEDVVKQGDTMDVKVIEASDTKVRVSRRHLIPGFVPPPPRERGSRRGNRSRQSNSGSNSSDAVSRSRRGDSPPPLP